MQGLTAPQVERLLSYLAKWGTKYTRALGDLSICSSVVLPQELLFPLLPQVRHMWPCCTADDPS